MSAHYHKTILLVEDEFIITMVEKKLLENFGFNVLTAATGEDAIEVFKNNDTIDLVLMDIDLGDGIDGTEAATTILKERPVPIVFLSSHTEPEIVEKTEKITSYGYILKNSGTTVLDASIKMAFKLFDAQQKMNERDERLQRAEIMAGFGNWELDLTRNIFNASEGALLIYGLTENELSAEIVQKCPLPGYRAMLDSALRDLIEQKAPYDVVFEIRRPNDGNLAFIHSIAKYDIARNCVTGIIHDITERKRVEDALKNSELKYRSLIEHSSDVVFCVDQNGEYKFVNQVFASTFGKTPEYFIGKTFWDIYPKEHADHRQAVSLKVFATGESQSTEVVVPLPDRTMYYLAKANPISDDTGKVLLNLTHATDITGRKLAEEKIKTLLAEKELFLKEVHHRIKNNMNTVAGIMSMQLETLNEPSAVEALKDARSRVQSMMILYDKLYRSDDFIMISFKDYFTPLVDEIIGNFPNREMVKTEKNIDDFLIDAKRLSPLGIIINELLTNIMKYAFAGQGNGLITFSSAVSDGRVRISIGDNGIGIPESVDISTSESFGLQLVYMMTRQLRGAMKMERGNGTKFILEFKL